MCTLCAVKEGMKPEGFEHDGWMVRIRPEHSIYGPGWFQVYPKGATKPKRWVRINESAKGGDSRKYARVYPRLLRETIGEEIKYRERPICYKDLPGWYPHLKNNEMTPGELRNLGLDAMHLNAVEDWRNDNFNTWVCDNCGFQWEWNTALSRHVQWRKESAAWQELLSQNRYKANL